MSDPSRYGEHNNGRVSYRTTPIADTSYLMGLGYTPRPKAAYKVGPQRIKQRQRETLKTAAYAAGTLLAFAAIGVMLAWRG